MLSKEEIKRFDRQIRLPEFGQNGQEKLRRAKVLVVGAGGLGCPAIQYLAATGIGSMGIVDFDTVEESNLHRQILYGVNDLGEKKALVAANKIQNQHPFSKMIPHPVRLTPENAVETIQDYDLVIDGSDNFATRYLVNDACVLTNKPLVFGSIYKYQAQIAVFNYNDGPTYRCLYPTPPAPDTVPNCEEAGVLGILPGIVGSYMANEAIKMIAGIGETLSGKLLILDILTLEQNIISVPAIKENQQLEQIIPVEGSGINCSFNETELKEITAHELKEKLDRKDSIQIIDVRDPAEYALCNIGGKLIPLDQIIKESEHISMEKEVVVHCHHGMRSKQAIVKLMTEKGYTNLINLKGGIHAWAMEVDSTMKRY